MMDADLIILCLIRLRRPMHLDYIVLKVLTDEKILLHTHHPDLMPWVPFALIAFYNGNLNPELASSFLMKQWPNTTWYLPMLQQCFNYLESIGIIPKTNTQQIFIHSTKSSLSSMTNTNQKS